MKVIAADVDLEYARLAENLRVAEKLPWADATEVHRRTEDPLADHWSNPVLVLLMIPLGRAHQSLLGCHARLRLLVAAGRYRAGLPSGPDDPMDPFTLAPIQSRTAGGKVRFWSVRDDGDQLGAGVWLPEDNTPADIVIEVPERETGPGK